jgi:hypothetical protein
VHPEARGVRSSRAGRPMHSFIRQPASHAHRDGR